MKKKMFLSLLMFILLFTACGPEGKVPTNSAENNGTVKMPQNLIIDFEPASIIEVETAAVIKANILSIDEKKAAKIFMTAPDEADFTLEAPGYMYRWKNADLQEFISVGMTGEYGSSGRKSNGTFSFSREDIQSYLIPLDDIVFKVSSSDQVWRRHQIADFEGERELDGISLTETRRSFEENLSALGISVDSFRATQTYCLTAEKQRELFPIYSGRYNPLTEQEQDLFSNGYAFSYRQFFNGIPVVDYAWHGYSGYLTYTQSVQGVFNANGLMQVLVSGVFLPVSQGEARSVLSIANAVEVLKAEFADVILLEPVRVFHAEITYLAGAKSASGPITLYPAWVFSTIKNTESGYNTETIYAFDAFTGKRIAHSGDFND